MGNNLKMLEMAKDSENSAKNRVKNAGKFQRKLKER